MSDLTRRDFLLGTAAVAISAAGVTSAGAQQRTGRSESEEGKDIYAILKKEHREVKQLLEKMAKTNDPGALEKDFVQLKQMVLPHAKAEEAVFYPKLLQSNRKTTLVATEEHHAAENMMKQLESTPISDEKWAAKLVVLKDMIDHHIKEEEGKVFEKARQAIKGDEAKQIGQQYLQKKQSIMAEIQPK